MTLHEWCTSQLGGEESLTEALPIRFSLYKRDGCVESSSSSTAPIQTLWLTDLAKLLLTPLLFFPLTLSALLSFNYELQWTGVMLAAC